MFNHNKVCVLEVLGNYTLNVELSLSIGALCINVQSSRYFSTAAPINFSRELETVDSLFLAKIWHVSTISADLITTPTKYL